jgi:hypothetical protein
METARGGGNGQTWGGGHAWQGYGCNRWWWGVAVGAGVVVVGQVKGRWQQGGSGR